MRAALRTTHRPASFVLYFEVRAEQDQNFFRFALVIAAGECCFFEL